jgi:hypothetical protein
MGLSETGSLSLEWFCALDDEPFLYRVKRISAFLAINGKLGITTLYSLSRSRTLMFPA